jgi:hypothetical protein
MTDYELAALRVLERIALALERSAASPAASAPSGSARAAPATPAKPPASAPAPAATDDVATDRDLDGPHGDPIIRTDPKYWKGESYKGRHMSECPTEYLNELVQLFVWQANNPQAYGNHTAEQKAKFHRLDAARARGWAIRNGAR